MGCMKKASARQAIDLPFSKLHGAGNDIIVFLAKHLRLSPRQKASFLRCMAHRQLGVGCDQFVEVLSFDPLSIQIWNGDGSTAEMCANGSRTFLYLASIEGWIDRSASEVSLTISGKPYSSRKVGEHLYELCLGKPEIHGQESITVLGKKIPFWSVSTGNPHAVVLTTSHKGSWKAPKGFSYLEFGPPFEKHPHFPKKTNVEFVRSISQKGKKITAVVEAWERGAGATLSCGSGAVAVAAVLKELMGATQFSVRMTDFELQIRFEGDQGFLSGPCALVAKGVYLSSL